MADCMDFPKTAEEFIEQYKFTDTKQEYTNGAELIPVFRVKQMLEHYFAKGNHAPGKWIPVTERLPEERDSFFAKFYGTERWADGMFLKISKEVLTCVEYTDGTIAVKALQTTDGKWRLGCHQAKVTHWMPLPEPPKGE